MIQRGLLALCVLFLSHSIRCFAQSDFELPDTPASEIFRDFIAAYNSGSQKNIESFVKANYSSVDSSKISEKTDYWMDIYYRFGEAKIHSLSINEPFDIEVWLQGTISKAWFAPEFILNKESKKIRALGMLLGTQPPGTVTPAENEEDFIKKLKEYLESNNQNGLFQGTVLIQKDDIVLIKEAYGLKNISKKEPNEIETKMNLASVTKIITSIAVMQLVQDGKLDLYTPILDYLPELPEQIGRKITISHLLNHTSGYELDEIIGFRSELEKTNSMSEVYTLHLKYLPEWENFKDFTIPGKFNYSNDSFDLLAIIIEKVSGLTFPEYLKQNIFDPAKMMNTSFDSADMAKPYRYDISCSGLMDCTSYYPNTTGQISGAAELKSTVEDLRSLFTSLMNTDDLLDMPHKCMLASPVTRRVGQDYQSLGLEINYETVLNIGHSGVNIGNSTEMQYFPNCGYLLIVLCNNRSGAPNFYNFFKNNLPK